MSEGRRVASGRLRVDAARAVGKLRDYQLPDPTAWVLEVIRAAVAFGASAIRVSGDADDVRVAWDGPAPDPEALAQLFDELVDPAPRRERRPLRLLATGVNTALGLEPRWVDVLVTDGEGGAMAARYSPRLLEIAGGAASRLRELRAEPRRPPPEAPARGGLVHLRRLPLLDAVPLMLGYGEPRELSIVRGSCDDATVPILVGRTELGHARSHVDLLRVALGEGIGGWLALVDPTFAGPGARLEAAELGVVLARYELPHELFPSPRAQVPLRLYVDAPRMPTNASRSAVRLDESPVREALALAGPRAATLIERLAAELGDAPSHAWTPTQRERLRAGAIQILAAHAAGEDWRERLVLHAPPALAPLLALPLLFDALGRPRAASSFSPRARGVERVHRGREPLPHELERWLGDALWIPPGDPSAALLGAWTPEPAEPLAALALDSRSERRRFEAQKRREPRLAGEDPRHLLIVPICAPGRSLKTCVPERAFAVEGLAGELALLGSRAGTGAISLLVEGRPIATWAPEHLAIEGVVSAAELMPSVDFRGIVEDEAFERVRGAVLAGAVVACEALAMRSQGRAARGDRARAVAPWLAAPSPEATLVVQKKLREGTLLALAVLANAEPAEARPSDHDGAASAVAAFLESKSPLADVPVWPTLGGGLASARELLGAGAREPCAIGFVVGSVDASPILGGRDVFLLRPREHAALHEWLPSARWIDYGSALRASRGGESPLTRGLLPARGALLEIVLDGARAAIAWGAAERSRLEVLHFGAPVAEVALDVEPPVLVRVDDARLLPTEAFTLEAVPEYPIASWVDALARAYHAALDGRSIVAAVRLGAPSALEATAALEAYFGWLEKGRITKRQLARLARVPFVRRLGLEQPSTLAAVAAETEGGAPIEHVGPHESAAIDLGGWHPVLATPTERRAFERILDRAFVDATERLEALRRAAARAQKLERHRARPRVDPTRGWRGPSVEVDGHGIERAVVTTATGERPRVEVAIEGRAFVDDERPDALPLDAWIDLPATAADEAFEQLSPEGRRRVAYVLGAGARALLLDVAQRDPTSLTAAPAMRRLLEAWCGRFATHHAKGADHKAATALAALPAFPTVQGGHAPLAAAVAHDGEALRVARWSEPWLEPAPGERASSLDRPVLGLVEPDPDRYQRMLGALWQGPVRDVGAKVARLQATRRVARGLSNAPRLEGSYDARFRFDLAEILDEAQHAEALETLGIGEVALADAPRSEVVFVRGANRVAIASPLVPSVHVAAHRSDLDARALASPELRSKVEAALSSLIGLVVRRAVDSTPGEQLPEWLRRALLTASLAGGALHFERLDTVPILPTAAGGWITPREVRAQAARFGMVWTTTLSGEPNPLDPERVVLRLDTGATRQLGVYAPAMVADEELALDRLARANLARPAVDSLDPTPEEEQGALAVIPLTASDGSSAHGTITLLSPRYAMRRGFYPSRSYHPLGRHDDLSRWPSVVRVDDPAFAPDRTWSAPVEDEVMRRLRSRVRGLVSLRLSELVPFRHGQLTALRVSSALASELPLPKGTELEGVTWLEPEPLPGTLIVRDAGGDRTLASVGISGAPLPVHAELLVAATLSPQALRPLAEALYTRLVARVADALSRAPGPDYPALLAHLFEAVRLGARFPDGALGRIPVPGWVPEGAFHALLAQLGRGVLVPVCAPAEVAMAQAALESPVLCDDGSAAVRALLGFLGPRAIGWRERMRAHVLGGVDAEAERELAREAPRFEPPPEERAAPADSPRGALEQAVLSRWNALAVGRAEGAHVDGRRKSPAVAFAGAHLRLAGRHPVVRRALEAFETGATERADALVTLLLAAATGARRRAGQSVGLAGEHALLAELMRQRAR
ncbi:MAG: hypothetical protein KF729_04360 [Sandaracinaceae bacterium]|nr:hypothetical protein [Sandaracinaceae bacterium]